MEDVCSLPTFRLKDADVSGKRFEKPFSHLMEWTKTIEGQLPEVDANRPGGCPSCYLISLRQGSATRLDLLEEVITLVVDEDKGREVLYLDFPDSLHAQLRILDALDALDVVLCQDSGRSTD